MLNADDQFTPASVSRLKQALRQKRPLVIWVGAGASRWAGLPSWPDSAKQMRKIFSKCVPNFPNDRAATYIDSAAYPDLFELCRVTDAALYNRTLVEQLDSPTTGLIYSQLIEGLKKIAPAQIVTTNIDLCLEQQLGTIDVIERTDLERCSHAILNRTPFVAKLHGSVSSIQSAVFTKSDYQQLSKCKQYIAAVKSLFSLATVVFLGYGLRDNYVLDLLAENDIEHSLFGNGPHFLVTASPGPPENGVHRIGYRTTQHQDHRAALTILDLIDQETSPAVINVVTPAIETVPSKTESGFYISHFRPSGTHVSGQALELNNPEDKRISALVGMGFVQGELPSSETVAFHDLAVGLTCFDRVYLPLKSLDVFHNKATFEVFWPLMESGAFRFVDIVHDPFFLATPGDLTGGIGLALVQEPTLPEARSAMSIVRKMLIPAPGKELEGQAMIEGLASSIVPFADSEVLNLPGMVRDALLMPRVSQLLGYSDYAVPSKIPRWLAYPTLRLAHLAQTGLICNQLGIRASRVPFGGVALLSAAFSIKPGEQTAFDYASFVMSGAFGSNLSTYIEQNPGSLLGLLKFRESAEGEALRREVSDRLSVNDGTEFSMAVEGSLNRAIPNGILQAARNKFSTLMKAGTPSASAEAVWADQNTGDLSTRLWRERSRQLLLEEARLRGVRSESPCLCGSGDRLRECCLRALS